MPEGLEAEIWRHSAEELIGRTIIDVWFDERVAPADLADALVQATITATRRAGKVVLVDTDGPTLGLHFGMTGRLVVDGASAIERLAYASGADRPEWDRLRVVTEPAVGTAPALRMNDPRRLGRLSLDPDLSWLGPDMFELTVSSLRAAFGRRRSAVKVALLDQHVVAGLGNLCADEVLFVAGVAPRRGVDTLTDVELASLCDACATRLAAMLAAGGSTHGDLTPEVRAAPGRCPRDGAALRRDTIGGRTAVWCPSHQR